MSIVLQFDAYVCDAEAPYNNVEYIGKAKMSVVENVSCVDGESGYCDSYNDLTNKVTDGELLGASTIFFSSDVDVENVMGRARLYMPSANYISVSSIYRSSDYRIKLVNESGYYILTQQLDVNSGWGANNGYDDTGVRIGSVYGSPHSLMWERLTDRNVYLASLVVSGITDGKIDTDATVLQLHYWGSNNLRQNYWYVTDAGATVTAETIRFLNGCKTVGYNEDPYEEGGISGTGGGTGTFDGTGDAISFPSLPTLSAVSTGFVTLYAPTLTQLNALASYMWSGGFDIDTFRKLFADPMDVILGLSIVPVSVPISGAQDVKVGNISTGISMNKASTQYVNVDCGSLQVKEYWGSCLDYAPNSKCQIFLPYIGTRSIDIDEIMGKTIHVKYAVDILSGAMVANIMCGSSVLYSFTGACSSSIPVVSRDFTSIISSAIQIAGNIGMAVATGGLSTPVTAASAVQLGVAAGQTAMNVANSKPSVQHSGAVGGTSGMLSVQTPYLIFELPRQSLPKGYNTFGGYPANITLQLGACTGFTKVEMIHLENIPATDAELNEIETLLKAGVIL